MKNESNVTIEITNNEFLRQFETRINGSKATIEYAQQERKIFLTKLRVEEAWKENIQVEEFIKAVLDNISETKLRIMPTSPEIVAFFKKNKRYKKLLPVGINI